jgi:hypothetical protein
LFEKLPEVPWLFYDQPDFDIDNLPELACGQQVAKREHARAESQLKIHRGDETELAADADDRSRRREIFAHRLLDEHSRAARQLLQHAGNLIAGHGEVENSVGRPGRLGK